MDKFSFSDSPVNDDQRHGHTQLTADPESNDNSESDTSGSESDQTPSEGSQITPNAELDNDKQPRKRIRPSLVFPPQRWVWNKRLTLRSILSAAIVRQWRRIALPTPCSV